MLQIIQLERFLPQREDIDLQMFEIEDEGEEDVHLDCVLTEYDLFEFIERQLIHAEADEIVEHGKQGSIILSIRAAGELRKDGVVGSLQESLVSLAPIEYLSHEDSLCVLTLDPREELFGVGVGSHYLFIECVDKLYALLDQLGILHPFVT
jgi:hypothetical protein